MVPVSPIELGLVTYDGVDRHQPTKCASRAKTNTNQIAGATSREFLTSCLCRNWEILTFKLDDAKNLSKST
eukprot:2793299-Pyramimonas_sp.AAC.2